MTFEYTNQNLSISLFEVNYQNKSTSQEVLNTWEDKRKTGFRLSWFLQDSNGSRLTEKMADLPSDWKPKTSVARYQEQYLVRMVQLASRARANNMTREEILDVTIREKAKPITSGFIQYNSMFSGGQVKKGFYPTMFNRPGVAGAVL